MTASPGQRPDRDEQRARFERLLLLAAVLGVLFVATNLVLSHVGLVVIGVLGLLADACAFITTRRQSR